MKNKKICQYKEDAEKGRRHARYDYLYREMYFKWKLRHAENYENGVILSKSQKKLGHPKTRAKNYKITSRV